MMNYNDCELCGSAVIDNEHRCLPPVRMRYQEDKAKERIAMLQHKIADLEKTLEVSDALKLRARLENIEADINWLLETKQDL